MDTYFHLHSSNDILIPSNGEADGIFPRIENVWFFVKWTERE